MAHLLPLLLPSFLQPLWLPYAETSSTYINAKFTHRGSLGDSHALWWPPRNGARPEQILLFVPGNPGLVDFYIPFLSAVYANSSSAGIAILAHGLLDHTPGIENAPSRYPADDILTIQVETSIEILDTITNTYPGVRVVTVAHSLGTWINLRMMKARPGAITSSFLLFPTLSNLANTPKGRLVWRLFSPLPRRILSSLAFLVDYIPDLVLAQLLPLWPEHQRLVMRRFASSSSCVNASIATAHAEMKEILDLDLESVEANRNRLWFYYGETDHWVGEEKTSFLKAFDPNGQSAQILHGPSEVPHEFCINHSDLLAKDCIQWLEMVHIPKP
ncbi:hypothetical protein CPB83DRAFT_855611 [Crepidotus variabilis]|uniref:Lipid droplet-associated hydrolase n=1 Tax=Crepidotus variabilis TaxID=179855 RepID=A0A9P6JPK0_9AGAR|nr:hypothetical protein CPB83DRAFT_855611 [Crepidotus variabilis]